MQLDTILNTPVTVMVAGVPLQFQELDLAAMGRLQQWIKAKCPHPLDVVKPHLAGFSAEDKAILLDQARREAASWPPEIGSAAAAGLLLTGKAGQVATLLEGLRACKPDATEAEAEWLYRQIKGDKGLAKKILSTIFGTDATSDDDDPKAEAGSPASSPSA